MLQSRRDGPGHPLNIFPPYTMKHPLKAAAGLCAAALSFGCAAQHPPLRPIADTFEAHDTTMFLTPFELPPLVEPDQDRYRDLTEEDYRTVAEELGVEVAAIKAVVDIEAGAAHEGFWDDGKPLINFDLSMYNKFAPRHGVSLTRAKKLAPEVFRRPDTRRHGSYQAAQQARLDAAKAIDEASALESTFWGMFQIGGFNWKKCDTGSVQEFVELMSRSERDQLELFAKFITNSGMVDDIRKKNWLAFALKYNGPKAKSRGYHTRLAAAYKKHKKAEGG